MFEEEEAAGTDTVPGKSPCTLWDTLGHLGDTLGHFGAQTGADELPLAVFAIPGWSFLNARVVRTELEKDKSRQSRASPRVWDTLGFWGFFVVVVSVKAD